jgi:dihydrofolate synthase/folylpolyglutamate synthase
MRNSYQAALDYLYRFTDYEKQSGYIYSPDRFNLARVRQLLALLGNPHCTFQSVHIAGTKGKGSTAAMIASILQQAGYRTALYTSPHLHTLRERIQVDGEMISEADVVAGVERLKAVEQVPEITTFELITALAFDYAARQKAELAVLEVGMGGRLDATNVVTPMVSVITPISYDHMMYLGDTLGKIAAEKAGIIKPGVPVVSAPQVPEAERVIEHIAAERNAPLTWVGRDWCWQSIRTATKGQQFAAWPSSDLPSKQTYSLPLLGRHQQINATTALATIGQMRAQGMPIADQAIHVGMRTVHWPGRLEVLDRRPWVIVDGAHNGDSMQKLRTALQELFPYTKLILVLGISADKDIVAMLDAILPAADQVLVTQARHPRAIVPGALAERIAARGTRVQTVPIEQAVDTALRLANEDDLICATGSLFLVADFKATWLKHNQKPLPPSDTK